MSRTIVVSGALANKLGSGGGTWVRLSWFLALRRLGFDVWFVEQIDPMSCVDSEGQPTDFDECANLAHLRSVAGEFGFADRATLIEGDGPRTSGLTYPELRDLAAASDLLVNISGHLTSGPLFEAFKRKAYVDLDPGYTQLWAQQGIEGSRLEGHDDYFTVGANIGTAGCDIPTLGLDWMPVKQPVLLEEWPVAPSARAGRFTSIGAWRGPYGRVSHGDTLYGLKAHEFRKILDLPRRTGQIFELALDIHPDDHGDIASLEEHGWRLVDPRDAAGSPAAFRDYVQASWAEFSVAQGVYVETNSGWFSDRTVRYLASGKPALVQETGASRWLPTGEGLLTFRDLDEAVTAAKAIAADYDRHARAARRLAEAHFDSDVVMREFLTAAGIG